MNARRRRASAAPAHGLAEAGPVDQRGDGRHRQRGHDRLVEPTTTVGRGHRQQDLRSVCRRWSRASGRLDALAANAADGVRGQPDQRRRRVDQRARSSAEAGPIAKNRASGARYTNVGSVCIRSRIGVRRDPGASADPDPERDRDQHAEEHRANVSDSVSMLSCHRALQPDERTRPRSASRPAVPNARRARRTRDHAEPADLRDRPWRTTAGLIRSASRTTASTASADRVERYEEERVALPGVERVTELGQPAVERGTSPPPRSNVSMTAQDRAASTSHQHDEDEPADSETADARRVPAGAVGLSPTSTDPVSVGHRSAPDRLVLGDDERGSPRRR